MLDKRAGGNLSLKRIHMETWAPGLAAGRQPCVLFSLAAQSCSEMDQESRSLDLPVFLRGCTGTQPQRLAGIWLCIQARPRSSSSARALGSVDEHQPRLGTHLKNIAVLSLWLLCTFPPSSKGQPSLRVDAFLVNCFLPGRASKLLESASCQRPGLS